MRPEIFLTLNSTAVSAAVRTAVSLRGAVRRRTAQPPRCWPPHGAPRVLLRAWSWLHAKAADVCQYVCVRRALADRVCSLFLGNAGIYAGSMCRLLRMAEPAVQVGEMVAMAE